MYKSKRENIQVFAGVHTITVRSDKPAAVDVSTVDWVNDEDRKPNSQGAYYYYYTLNLNRYVGHDLWTLVEFSEVLVQALQFLGLYPDWVFNRIDFRFDQLERNFDDLYKMHLLLIGAMVKSFDIVNFWLAREAFSYTELSIRAQNARRELENYNKFKQDPECPAGNRLEFRSHKLNDQCSVGDEMLAWIQLARKAVDQKYSKVLDTCNDELFRLWQKETQSGSIRMISEFVRKYQNTIFSRAQLAQLMERLGQPNPKTVANNQWQRNKLEGIGKKDLYSYLDKLEEAARAYIDGTQIGYKRDYFAERSKD